MATIIRGLLKGYHYMNTEIADPRVQDWFLMGSPWPGLALLTFYLYFVQSLGPRLMKDRKPFNLDRLMQIYNIVQIILSGYLLYKALVLAWLWDYSLYCEPVDYSDDPKAVEVSFLHRWQTSPDKIMQILRVPMKQRTLFTLQIAGTVWIYFIVKVIDLLDTVFFVLRKKSNQISFLHVYHHTGMVIGSWAGVKYLPGGHGTFLGLVNSFVHVVMYGHYFATSMKISRPWWKKYITQLQLIQFVLILVHFSQLAWIEDCGFPRWPALIFVPQNLFMIVLFGDFYYKTYVRKSKGKAVATNGVSNGIAKATSNGKPAAPKTD
ncbi:elongation of very long chain fatty acids protein 7-like isoform X1 [Athalia rosae]|uniref:elongation of very long chain fatty acids protein 7-like isoform X1 n=1 Tax=Athalia rosae TaxID=37344 RepID=UPI0020346313|nr:elongation of very long chain fatty acids protein 7-like isoform X1 [Athalia rosae]